MNHEKSNGHITCFREWKELELRSNKNKTIDDENLRLMKQEEKYWKSALKRIIAFNPLMNEYLHKIHDNETKVQYLSKDVQNEMIKLLANVVQNEIISL